MIDSKWIISFVIFLRFRAGVKDLEVMVQNLISSAFETITTVQEGVEILDIFQHLSSREVSVGHKYPEKNKVSP